METPPTLETVYQAVHTLYHNPDTTEKEKASLWLGELQKSVYAWKIADELLHRQSDVESCYFAAQTMRTKIQYSFHELPLESHGSLRDSLLEHIAKVTETTSSVIVTQLCVALADLVLQMTSWQKPVIDLINKFGLTNLLPLLEIMTVLPEEVNSRALRLGSNRRHEILQELKTCVNTVSDFLKACLANQGDNTLIQMRVLRCFTSWVSVHGITLPEIADNIVVANAFHVLSNHQSENKLHEAASDCVCALLQCLEDNNNQQTLEAQLFQGVVALEEGYHMSVAHEDLEKSINYCRVFTELAETFLEKIVNASNPNELHFAVKILDIVLICVGHHDYEVAAITFNLWYRLSEELYQKNNDPLTYLFKPYIERLIEALSKHCQIEPDHEGLLEEGDDFADFRIKVSELIKDVVFIVGSSNCFRQMFLSLQTPNVTWEHSEAALFIMQAVAKNVLPEENDVVPKVVEAILNLPQNTHIAVRYTSLLLLGELCEWIEKHPQSLEPVLNFLLFCLQQPKLASAAATALQSICSACCKHMDVHFNGIAQIIQSLDTFSISNEAAIGLLRGVSMILGKMPPEQLHQSMKEICWLQVKPLAMLLETDVKIERGTKTDPTLWLDRLAAIFRYTQTSVPNGATHPCVGIVTEIWPVLSATFNKYLPDVRTMERCGRVVKFAIRCVGKQSAHLLEPIVKQILSLYNQYQHSCFLYLGSVLVTEFANEPGCIEGLSSMLQAFITPTFTILQENNGLKNHPDTVEDFFRLCSRFLQNAPLVFLNSQSLNGILHCALLATSLDHKDANASVMKFFYDLVHCGRNKDTNDDFAARSTLIKQLVQKHGKELVNNLIQACVFSLQSYMLSDVADVIMELLINDRESLGIWLGEALKSLPLQNSSGCVTATPAQLEEFHQTLLSSENVKGLTHTLRAFARLFR
ncbi:hypothetical protein LSTR_LSTR005848 [Laodelphax striatellus]|uniref:Transportin-3 n=1 Tax=Laodelphax striatellus TaxID=195883 RepID=A0A482WS04_LAOST|nr:hypothetical protein LSTR_LSTR005848 [Laodelphax striatellus]